MQLLSVFFNIDMILVCDDFVVVMNYVKIWIHSIWIGISKINYVKVWYELTLTKHASYLICQKCSRGTFEARFCDVLRLVATKFYSPKICSYYQKCKQYKTYSHIDMFLFQVLTIQIGFMKYIPHFISKSLYSMKYIALLNLWYQLEHFINNQIWLILDLRLRLISAIFLDFY